MKCANTVAKIFQADIYIYIYPRNHTYRGVFRFGLCPRSVCEWKTWPRSGESEKCSKSTYLIPLTAQRCCVICSSLTGWHRDRCPCVVVFPLCRPVDFWCSSVLFLSRQCCFIDPFSIAAAPPEKVYFCYSCMNNKQITFLLPPSPGIGVVKI